MKQPMRPRLYRTLALAGFLACEPAFAVESFVHSAWPVPPAFPADAATEGVNPQIEKLLGQPAGLWERIRLGFAIPDLDSRLVSRQVAWYVERPDLIQAIVLRARPYLHFIVDAVERRGLPTELALLPFIESGFNPRALSPAQASGLWQFIPETASKYNLRQDTLYDGRRDVIASTGAALDYLQFLYEYNHRDWQRALASYNWGESAVARAVERNRARGLADSYDMLSMPEETRNYVPRLLAIKSIVSDPAAHGLNLPDIANEPVFNIVPIAVDLELKLAAQFADTPLDEFLTLNPAFNSKLVPGGMGARLIIPVEKSEAFKVNLERHRESLERQAERRPSAAKPAKSPAGTRF
jgi:membrane-bound lytic murein transglycosylase D